MNVILSPRAFDQLESITHLNEKLARIIKAHLEQLPFRYPLDKQLKGPHFSGRRSHRVGDYRIVYTVEHGRLIITIITIVHRREVYEN